MTDALCGPSNPLQNFQKHTAVDRTLQHDRLASRQGHAQGFRSSNSSNAGLLDPEFEAFEAGATSGAPEAYPPFASYQQELQHPLGQLPNQAFPKPLQAPQHIHEHQRPQPRPSGRASGFQQRYSDSSFMAPSSRQHQVTKPSQRAWHEEFQSHHQASPTPYQHQQPYPSTLNSFSYAGMQRPPSFVPSQPAYGQSSEARWKGKGKWQSDAAQDSAAFEREFEALSTQEELYFSAEQAEANAKGVDRHFREVTASDSDKLAPGDSAQQEDHFSGDDLMLNDDWLRAQPMLSQDEVIQVPDPEADQQPAAPLQDDEEMRATARRVVDHVQDDTSEKFKKSEFFALMRQIRDGEKQVKEDDIITVDRPPQPDASSILPAQLDADLGRDFQMAGALSPHALTNGTSSASLFDQIVGGKPSPFIPPP